MTVPPEVTLFRRVLGLLATNYMERTNQIMADLTALETQLTQDKADADAAATRVAADLAALAAQVKTLQDQIAALTAGEVSQAQIDALITSAAAIDSAVVAIDPAAPPVA